MKAGALKASLLASAVWGLAAGGAEAQLPSHLRDYPLARLQPSGDLVTPFFDGWYDNGDETVTYVFGFMNRNLEESVDIPIGPNNHITPAAYDGVQPTHFPAFDQEDRRGAATSTRNAIPGTTIPRGMLRERGAFAVTVPAGIEVVWTLTHAGHTYSIPGRATSPAYQFSHAPAAAGSMSPAIRFEQAGIESVDREGIVSESVTTAAGIPVRLSALIQDRGVREQYDPDMAVYPVTGSWLHHQGPGAVHFDPERTTHEGEGWGEVVTQATFSLPGEYIVRLRADNFGASDSRFGKQCCWSNAYVPVRVTP